VAHDPERLVYTVPEAGRLLGLGRNAAYDAAKRGDIPTLKIGRLLLVPKIPFHRMLEMTGTGPATATETTDAGAKLPTTAGAKGEVHDRPNLDPAKLARRQPSQHR
jgi:excisionase family DNA binding protein